MILKNEKTAQDRKNFCNTVSGKGPQPRVFQELRTHIRQKKERLKKILYQGRHTLACKHKER